MSEQMIQWLLGGLAAFGIYELRGIRNSIDRMRESLVEHSVRIDHLEDLVNGRPCVNGAKGRCDN